MTRQRFHLPLVIALALALAALAPSVHADALRVCADPNNLPYSNEAGEGFENRIAQLIADHLDRSLEYTWWAQRRGFLRNTLYAGECDVVIGIPSGVELVLATRPYYRASYVFVSRTDSGHDVQDLDDPILKKARVGVHLVGDDYVNTPPVHALAARGIIDNVTGYMIYGDYSRPGPTGAIIDAVANGDIDIAIAWGPIAGYFAASQDVPLDLKPVQPMIDRDGMSFTYAMSLGVRLEDWELKGQLDEVLVERRADIDAILAEYNLK